MNSPASLDLLPVLQRIAEALERLAPAASSAVALDGADAFVWHPERDRLEPVHQVNRVDLSLLQGIPRQTEPLYRYTRPFAQRKNVVEGKGVAVRGDSSGRRLI